MIKKIPYISVVIPAYNEEKYLPRCLKSLKNQDYPKNKFVVMVIDNNSTDNTKQIAKSFGAKVIHEKKQGHIFSFNTGLKKASGDIIAITDADTAVSKNWLKTLSKVFDDQKVVGVTGSLKLNVKTQTISKIFKNSYDLFSYLHAFINRPHLVGPNMAIRRSAFLKLKGADTRYKIGGDVEIGMRLRKLGKVRFVEELSVTTSPRRFNRDVFGFLKGSYLYTLAYIYAIWLMKPPQGQLLPIR